MMNLEQFHAFYGSLKQDEGLMTTLVQMQVQRGYAEQQAYKNADTVMRLVVGHGTLENLVSDDAMAVMRQFLDASRKMQGCTRKLMLHQVYFGLKLYQSNELSRELAEGKSYEKVFEEYYVRCGEDASITEEILERDIYRLISNHHISSEAMCGIVRRWEASGDLLASSEALGAEGYRFKCVAAMGTFLESGGEMRLSAAVNQACSDIELQAVADAVHVGEMTYETARKVIEIILLAAFFVGMCLLFFPTDSAKLLNLDAAKGITDEVMREYGAIATLTNLVGNCYIDKLAAWIGKLAAQRSYAKTCQKAGSLETMKKLAARESGQETASACAAKREICQQQADMVQVQNAVCALA